MHGITKLTLIVALAMGIVPMAYAAPSCAPTGTIPTQNYPGGKKIPSTNNLMLPAGKAIEAEGQKIIITGRVRDTHCVPVQDASVVLWQNSPTGRWLLAGDVDLATPGPVFAGAGRTYTDNEGNFMFITAFPAPLGQRAPFVNLKVSGEGIPDIMTALYFSNDARNDTDKNYMKQKEKARNDTLIVMHQDENGDLIGTIDLVISSRVPFRSY